MKDHERLREHVEVQRLGGKVVLECALKAEVVASSWDMSLETKVTS